MGSEYGSPLARAAAKMWCFQHDEPHPSCAKPPPPGMAEKVVAPEDLTWSRLTWCPVHDEFHQIPSERSQAPLCPEHAQRSTESDDQFWERVQRNIGHGDEEYDEAERIPLDAAFGQDPCYVCGSFGACAWDSEGRPMIHALSGDDDDDS